MDISNSSGSVDGVYLRNGSAPNSENVSVCLVDCDSERGDLDEVIYNPNEVLQAQQETIDFASTCTEFPSKSTLPIPRLPLVDKEEATNASWSGLPKLLPSSDPDYSSSYESDSIQSLQDMEEGLSAGKTAERESTIIDVDELIANRAALAASQKTNVIIEKRAMASRLGAMRALPPRMARLNTNKTIPKEPVLSPPEAPRSPGRSILSSACSLQSIEEGSVVAPMASLRSVYINGSMKSVDDWDEDDAFVIGAPRTMSSTHETHETGSGRPCLREDFGKSKTRPSMSNAMSLRSLGSFSFKFGKSMTSLLSVGNHDSIVSGHGHLSSAEYLLVEETLKTNFLFKNLSKSALHTLVLAFERTEATKDEIIISQGDTCDNGYVYVIAEGLCSVIVDGVVVPGPYGTLARKTIFGELGVLYNAKRGATISVKSDSVVLFRAHGDAFTKSVHIVSPKDGNSDDTPAVEDLHDIDDAINQLTGTKQFHDGQIIRQYEPGRSWLWSQWHGTILQHNFHTCLYAMLLSLLLVAVVRVFGEPTWTLGLAPDEDHPWIEVLSMVQKLWVYQMTLTTFIISFFLNQAYSFWQNIIVTTRNIQGRINDFLLLLATSAERNQDGTFTPRSEALLDDVAASSRLFHALFWASAARRFRPLATPAGLERMVQRGMMTQKQFKVLDSLNTGDTEKFNACLEWMMVRTWQGMEEGVLRHGDPLQHQLMGHMCKIRANTATVVDSEKIRMPLAYTHFVQILVDTFVVISPFALYPDLGVWSILCVGIMTLFYTGLLDLAKIFLDPLENQHFTKTSVHMGVDLGVLTREINASSVHFKESGASMPFAKSVKPF